MPDTPSDEELGLDPQEMERLDPNIRTELRNARKIQRDAAATAQRNQELERDLAITKAGIPDSPLGQMFSRAYDGPLDDPQAIKSAFEALGVTTPPQGGDPNAQGDQGQPAPGSDPEIERLRQLQQVGNPGAMWAGPARTWPTPSTPQRPRRKSWRCSKRMPLARQGSDQSRSSSPPGFSGLLNPRK